MASSQARITGANTVAEAFIEANKAGIALGDAVASAAWRTAANALNDPAIALEILVFNREGELMGQAPFASSHDPSRPLKRR